MGHLSPVRFVHVLRDALNRPTVRRVRSAVVLAAMALLFSPAFAAAQTDPWTNIGYKFSTIFTGPLPRYLGLAAIGMGGISHAMGEHGMSSKWANIFIGVGTSVFAVQGYAYFFL